MPTVVSVPADAAGVSPAGVAGVSPAGVAPGKDDRTGDHAGGPGAWTAGSIRGAPAIGARVPKAGV